METFWEKEEAYRKKTQGIPVSLDNLLLTLEYEDFKVIGRPDRIDQHADGIFIIEYKSSGQSPHGQDMVSLGYRLQLPAYALAARQRFSQPVLGAQFVELNRKGGRSSGLFFCSVEMAHKLEKSPRHGQILRVCFKRSRIKSFQN